MILYYSDFSQFFTLIISYQITFVKLKNCQKHHYKVESTIKRVYTKKIAPRQCHGAKLKINVCSQILQLHFILSFFWAELPRDNAEKYIPPHDNRQKRCKKVKPPPRVLPRGGGGSNYFSTFSTSPNEETEVTPYCSINFSLVCVDLGKLFIFFQAFRA